MSSTQTTPFRHKPYVNIEHPRADDMMNNENVNPSSPFTTPLTTSTLTRAEGMEGKSVPAEPTVAFVDYYQEPENNDDGARSAEHQQTNEDTSTSTADLHAAIERRFNESTNANSGERSILRQHPASGSRFRGIFLQRGNQHNGSLPGTPTFFGKSTKNVNDKEHATTTADPACEGYNIEQRNCNMFECTGEI